MKIIYFFLLSAFTTISISQNLVVNPTFVNGLTEWSSTDGGTGTNPLYVLPTHVTNDGQDDNFSVKYIATFVTGFEQKFNIVPGSTVSVSFWYKAVRTDGATTGNTCRIWSVFTNPTSSTPTTPINPPSTSSSSDDPLRNNNNYLSQTSTWTQVTVSSTVPAGATVFQLQLRAYNGATVSFDNISFSSPGASVLNSPSFDNIYDLTMYPNPLTGNTLYLISNANATMEVQIFNTLGTELVNTVVVNNSVNVSGLTPGIYIAKITQEGKSAIKKLIIE